LFCAFESTSPNIKPFDFCEKVSFEAGFYFDGKVLFLSNENGREIVDFVGGSDVRCN
jgi:hypothetical protein